MYGSLFKGLKMNYVKKTLIAFSVVLFVCLLATYKLIDGKLYLLGYVYAKPSLFFAGIETRELWQVEESSSYCGITKDGQYVMVVMDSIFVGTGAKEVCLNP